jgi:hypothetical protein
MKMKIIVDKDTGATAFEAYFKVIMNYLPTETEESHEKVGTQLCFRHF